MRRTRYSEHVAHDKFSANDVEDPVLVWNETVKTGGYRQVLCTVLQFSTWYELLVKEADEAVSDNKSTLGKGLQSEKRDFGVCGWSGISISNTRFAVHIGYQAARKEYHTNATEQKIFFCSSGSAWKSFYEQLNCKPYTAVSKTHPSQTNVKKSVMREPIE